MLRSVTVKHTRSRLQEDVLIIPITRGERKLPSGLPTLDRATRAALSEALSRRVITGERGQVFMASPGSKAPALLVGLGERNAIDAEAISDAAGAAAAAVEKNAYRSAAVMVPDYTDAATFARAFVKGASLAGYRFKVGKTQTAKFRRLSLRTADTERAVTDAARRGQVIAEFIGTCRDLVNEPANILTPSELAKRARALSRENGLTCTVLGAARLAQEGMAGMLGVARGSVEEPKLIVMHYNRSREDLPLVCLVGKGVTFDSGGISLKPWDGMWEMKGDMGGGAAVLSAVNAAARLELPVRVTALVPAVENMPDGDAYRPGDVITMHSGKTVEVLSTDAEGRIVLADTISYARTHFNPDLIVDFATLTGAVLVALGTRMAGVMGNSQEDIDALLDAGDAAGEPVWQLPLDETFYKKIKGEVSDIKNHGGRYAGTITAAAFLGEFVGKTPWVHVDIAGTFWADGNASYHSKGATGYGVDLAVSLLESIAEAE